MSNHGSHVYLTKVFKSVLLHNRHAWAMLCCSLVYTTYIQRIYKVYTTYLQRVYNVYTTYIQRIYNIIYIQRKSSVCGVATYVEIVPANVPINKKMVKTPHFSQSM